VLRRWDDRAENQQAACRYGSLCHVDDDFAEVREMAEFARHHAVHPSPGPTTQSAAGKAFVIESSRKGAWAILESLYECSNGRMII
jgi:hypothetical protein